MPTGEETTFAFLFGVVVGVLLVWCCVVIFRGVIAFRHYLDVRRWSR